MKRTLIVMRHAKTEEQKENQKDFERNLTERGINDAKIMAERLLNKGFQPDSIITSSANRTQQTAQIIAEQLGFPTEKIISLQTLYLSDSRTLTNVIEEVDESVKCCMIIGHNPGISEFAFDINRASTTTELPTSGLVVYRFVADNWKDLLFSKTKIELYDYPKK